MIMSALKTKMNVQSFPRPPKLEKISRQIRISWEGQDIADTKDAYWVLETHHPPSSSLLIRSKVAKHSKHDRTIC